MFQELMPLLSQQVLIDDSGLRELVQEVLGAGGYKVLVAGSGGDALRVSEQYHRSIDALITDVTMPHISGPELAKSLVPLRPRHQGALHIRVH